MPLSPEEIETLQYHGSLADRIDLSLWFLSHGIDSLKDLAKIVLGEGLEHLEGAYGIRISVKIYLLELLFQEQQICLRVSS